MVVLIKKYTNRKFYVPRGNTEPVGYRTLKEVMSIAQSKDIKVVCNITGEDRTIETLTSGLQYIDLSLEVLIELIRGEYDAV